MIFDTLFGWWPSYRRWRGLWPRVTRRMSRVESMAALREMLK
jgi:hypothetical protein